MARIWTILLLNGANGMKGRRPNVWVLLDRSTSTRDKGTKGIPHNPQKGPRPNEPGPWFLLGPLPAANG